MTLERRTPLRRTGRIARRTAMNAAGGPKPARRLRTAPKPSRRALDAEWDAYSADQRARRPRCEAGPAMLRAGIAAGARCWGTTTALHHKHPHGSGGPYVPSLGLGDSDVVAICAACHAYVHDSGDRRVRAPSVDLLRPHKDPP